MTALLNILIRVNNPCPKHILCFEINLQSDLNVFYYGKIEASRGAGAQSVTVKWTGFRTRRKVGNAVS